MKTYFPDITSALSSEVDGFITESRTDQIRVMWLLDVIAGSDSRYRVEFSHRGGAKVGKELLLKIFGTRRTYERLLPKYFYGVQGSKSLGRPNIYIPKDSLLRAYLTAVKDCSVKLVSSDGQPFKYGLKRNAIPKRRTTKDLDTNPNASDFITVNRDQLLALLEHPRCSACDQQIKRLLILSNTSDQPGKIPLSYERKWNGRLFDSLCIQNTSKWIKHRAFMGSYDYDIENCHFTLFAQLCSRIGLTASHVLEYSLNRSKYRQQICADLNITPNAEGMRRVKTALLSIIYGSLESSWKESAIFSALGDGVLATAFNNHPIVRGIRQEISQYSALLIASAKHPVPRDGYWVIRGGNSLTYLSKLDSKKEFRRTMSFLLTSHEAHILDAVLRSENSVDLCMHDGWISSQSMDIERIQEGIQHHTGFAVNIEQTPMNGLLSQTTCKKCAEILSSGSGTYESHANQQVTSAGITEDINYCSANGLQGRGSIMVRAHSSKLCSWSDTPPYPVIL